MSDVAVPKFDDVTCLLLEFVDASAASRPSNANAALGRSESSAAKPRTRPVVKTDPPRRAADRLKRRSRRGSENWIGKKRFIIPSLLLSINLEVRPLEQALSCSAFPFDQRAGLGRNRMLLPDVVSE